MTNLTRIANKCGTDKGTEHFEKHGYTEEYAKYIPDLGKYTLLEIGVYKCESMRMWEQYNPDMSIHGIDIDPGVVRYYKTTDTFPIYIGDAVDPKFVSEVIEITKSPDFIIDDGSHKYEDILATFKLLYPELKSGGYYFIEDLHAPQAQIFQLLVDLGPYFTEFDLPFELKCNQKLLIIRKP